MEIYLANKKIILDQNQQKIFVKLQELAEKFSSIKKIQSIQSKSQNPPSLYIHGAPGSGKSMLTNNFFVNLKIKNKIHFHFNDFMQQIHRELHKLRKAAKKNNQDQNQDLINHITKNIIADNCLLYLDEFQVEDVADALILRRIFSYIFKNNIAVVLTSNSHPRDLYPNGLQRDLFLKFIDEVLNKNCQIINLDSGIDYRRQYLQLLKKHYFTPNNAANRREIEIIFEKLIGDHKTEAYEIKIWERKLLLKKTYKTIVYFDFDELCAANHSAADYQAICQKFALIFLIDVPKLEIENRNEAKRLILFVDEIYENKCALLILADGAPEEIYQQGIGAESFKRTASRLNEIMSDEYFCKSKFILQ